MCFQERALFASLYGFISPLASACNGKLATCPIPSSTSTPTTTTTPATPTTPAALPGSPTQTNSTSASASPASPVVAAALGGIAAAGVLVAVFAVAYRAHLLRQRRRLGAAMRSSGRILHTREAPPRGLC